MGCINMIIYNPSTTQVQIIIKGQTMTVDSNDYVEVADSYGAEWIKIHQFLTVVDSLPGKKVEKIEEVQEVQSTEAVEVEEVAPIKKTKVVKKK